MAVTLEQITVKNKAKKYVLLQVTFRNILLRKTAQFNSAVDTYLNLSDLALGTLPETLSELTWLSALSLSRNAITYIIK